MLVSIITPTYNSEKTIKRNINSIINQTHRNFEHIIVDNESKDNTINIINKVYNGVDFKRFEIFSEKDNGIADAFNKGIKRASGEIIAILNSDDEYFHACVLEEVVNAFNDRNILLVYGNVLFEDNVYGTNIRNPIESKITGGIDFIHPAVFFRKSVYSDLGLYDESFKVSMDFDYCCRLANKYDVKRKSIYLKDRPLVKMWACGKSWKNEFESIEEIKVALIKNHFWRYEGKKFYYLRKYRTLLKQFLTKLKLTFIVTVWRNIKWKNRNN